MPTQPVRLAPDLLTSAKKASSRSGRTMAQQIAHWARVGRELDSSPSLSVARARQVSAAAYDQLQPEQQAVVRVLWESQIEKRAATLDLSAHFAGRDYVVAGDASGRAVKVAPPGPREAATAPKKAPARKTAAAKAAAAKSKAVAKKVPARRDVATGGHVKKKAVARKTAAATSGKSSTRKAVSDAVMAGAAVNVAAGKSRVAAKRG